ncbi:putative COQ9 [Lyophyllum shimeji]|uniref:Ubiquinone biosynthesis protein n=1 Tax=Lyophyllum shimeji TaxID=47721 RepID=A0A9P3UPH2_LYOSH|nr:putative COQ9 [Lyophyllum shimeji]
MSSARLLRLAFPLVPTHGFTREALARSVLALPPAEAHSEPLSDTAVDALFGRGDLARKTLIRAWLDDGIRHIQSVPPKSTLKQVLRARLEFNEPVLQYLPEAFALVASPTYGPLPLDPRPALQHAARIADEACHVTGDASLQLAWYARRGSLAAIYMASELHQLTSPATAYDFLDSLIDESSSLKSSLDEVTKIKQYELSTATRRVMSLIPRCPNESLTAFSPHHLSQACLAFPYATSCLSMGLPSAPGFLPNFFATYSVVLDHPIADVFLVIGTFAGHERVTRLSAMCSGFELLNADTVTVPEATSLADISVRIASPSEKDDTGPLARQLPRQFFIIHETVPVVFGLVKTHVSLAGTLTWDADAKLALYESKTRSGIDVMVWKLRRFEGLEWNRTRVTETIHGRCPAWLRGIVESQTRAGHVAHMDLYHTLF